MENLEQVIRHCRDRKNYPTIFDIDCGLDIVLPEKKLHAVKGWRRGNRKAVLNITSFRGISSDASHYYGNIVVDGVHMEFDDKPGHTTGVYDIPLADLEYDIELLREVTQDDIDSDPRRWEYSTVGEMTSRFDTIEELLTLFETISKHRFVGEWEFKVSIWYNSTVRTIDEFKKYISK